MLLLKSLPLLLSHKPIYQQPLSLRKPISASKPSRKQYPFSHSYLTNIVQIMKVLVVVVLILALTGHSDANWCVCRTDVSDSALQKAIDYACGAGADCAPINQNGPCYNPNTIKAHCSYAVNSYFQRKGQGPGTCDFSASATVVTVDPSPGGACTFPATASSGGGGMTTNPPTTTTPSTNMPPPSTTTPSTNMPPSTTTPSTNMPPSSTTTPSSSTFGPPTGGGVLGGGMGNGLGPSGTGIGTDNSDGQRSNFFSLVLITLWFSGLFFLWV